MDVPSHSKFYQPPTRATFQEAQNFTQLQPCSPDQDINCGQHALGRSSALIPNYLHAWVSLYPGILADVCACETFYQLVCPIFFPEEKQGRLTSSKLRHCLYKLSLIKRLYEVGPRYSPGSTLPWTKPL
jgi:hypothetical protein